MADETYYHKCPAFEKQEEGRFGSAVKTISTQRLGTYENGPDWWWMDNGEYATGPIHYCPFCGGDLALICYRMRRGETGYNKG